MNAKSVKPTLGANSFTCPHCGAVSHQSWSRVYSRQCEKDQAPWMPKPDIVENLKNDPQITNKDGLIKYFERILTKELFAEALDDGVYCRTELKNLFVSKCYSCDEHTLWIADNIIYPASTSVIEPSADMPQSLISDFREAAAILDRSPRGAAALLRLCIQKLMVELSEKGKNVDHDIGALVKKGLDPKIQKALDVVRVIGNNAVHPGQIDLKDDKSIAFTLFNLVNLIVESMISTPKHIDSLYSQLPEGVLKAIEKRDS